MTPDGEKDLADHDYQRLAAFRYGLRRFLRFSENAARSEGLTPHQHQLLLAIRGWEGDIAPNMSDIAEQLQLKVHSAGELVHRAEESGLLSVEVDSLDHRRQRVKLTDTGRATLQSLSMAHREELRSLQQHIAQILELLEDSA